MTDITATYNFLEEQKIKHSNLGYRFLTTSILLGMESPSLAFRITDLYAEVAKIHATSISSVERAIRHSLLDKKMVNKEYITRAVDKLTDDQSRYKESKSRTSSDLLQAKPGQHMAADV